MDVKVKTKYLKISPRKLRLVVNMVRGKKAEKAREILTFTPNKGARMVSTLLDSALSIVKTSEVNGEGFYIKSISCGDGPRLKRGTPVSKGKMAPITKRQSHLQLILSDEAKKEETKKKKEASKEETKVHPVESAKSGSQSDIKQGKE
ncbi:MAG: uL22 family ribosomal protein [Patescibacteria group bacterium]